MLDQAEKLHCTRVKYLISGEVKDLDLAEVMKENKFLHSIDESHIILHHREYTDLIRNNTDYCFGLPFFTFICSLSYLYFGIGFIVHLTFDKS